MVVSHELVDRSLVSHVSVYADVAETLHTYAERVLFHVLEPSLRLFRSAGYAYSADDLALERREVYLCEEVAQVDYDERVSQVRLVRTVLEHSFLERDPSERRF